MKLISVNVGRPRLVHVDGETVSTAIYKDPVTGPVHVARLNLDGDRQADLNVHGGVNKAVYGYPVEHYEFWRERYPNFPWQWGAFRREPYRRRPARRDATYWRSGGDRFSVADGDAATNSLL